MRNVYLGQKYMSKNHNMIVANKSCVDVENFKYVGPSLTKRNCIHEEMKSRLNSVTTCSHLAQNP